MINRTAGHLQRVIAHYCLIVAKYIIKDHEPFTHSITLLWQYALVTV